MEFDSKTTAVKLPQILGISVSKIPFLTIYLEGETEPDLSGGELSIVYEDGSTKVIPMVDDLECYIRDDKVVVRCFGKMAKYPIQIVRQRGLSNTTSRSENTLSEMTDASRLTSAVVVTEAGRPEPIVGKASKRRPVVMNGKYKYVNADWVVKPYYSSTDKFRFVNDLDLEEIYE